MTEIARPIRLFERVAKFEPLLPPEMEEKRLNSRILDSLLVCGRQDIQQHIKFKPEDQLDQNTYSNFVEHAKPFVLKVVGEETSEPLYLMDKLQPHALHEIMIISATSRTRSSIPEHHRDTRRKIFHIMSQFPSFAKEYGLYPYIAFSYDPLTLDRESGQSEKRFHAHLIGRTMQELQDVQKKNTKLAEVSPLRRRRLIDETTIISSLAIYDYLSKKTSLNSVRMIMPYSEKECPGILFELNNGWQTINTSGFDADFLQIYYGIEVAYREIMGIITEGENGIWQRAKVNKVKKAELSDLTWLSEKSRENIVFATDRMKIDFTPKMTQVLKNPACRDLSMHVYPLADLCYSTALFEEDNSVYCLIRPQMFSDLGGAGVEYLHGVTTKLRRGEGEFSQAEMEERKYFQENFLQRIPN